MGSQMAKAAINRHTVGNCGDNAYNSRTICAGVVDLWQCPKKAEIAPTRPKFAIIE